MATDCARNAASSAFSTIQTPPPSPPWPARLQHRGQEAAGTWLTTAFVPLRAQTGLVGDHSSAATIDRLPGRWAIGHVRYSTTGETILRNVQPLFAELEAGGLAVAHNGNLTNGLTLRRELIRGGAICQSTSDTEVVLLLAARSRRPKIVDRFVEALAEIEGAYALVALTNKKLIGARDPLGIRPLVLGELEGSPILCSETCALDIIGRNSSATSRTAKGGHRRRRRESFFPLPRQPARPCIFEYIYFARPDSIVHGRSVYDARKAMGAELAREASADADVVVPVPDSGVPAAIGYAQACGLPFELGIIRNHYVGRTFIQPTQSIRELGVRMKHNANRAVVEGKRIVLIDDSIVRGTTSVKITEMLREAGAREIHFRISSPPIAYPDFYGIDTPERDKLLAAPHGPRAERAVRRRPARCVPIRGLTCHGYSGQPGYSRSSPILTFHRRPHRPVRRPIRRFRTPAPVAVGRGELDRTAPSNFALSLERTALRRNRHRGSEATWRSRSRAFRSSGLLRFAAMTIAVTQNAVLPAAARRAPLTRRLIPSAKSCAPGRKRAFAGDAAPGPGRRFPFVQPRLAIGETSRIDVHRLEKAAAGADRSDVAASDVVSEGPMAVVAAGAQAPSELLSEASGRR
jgi:amidophosphoribosyltransferase